MTSFPDINQFVSHCFQQNPLLVQQKETVITLFNKLHLNRVVQPNQVTHLGWQPLPFYSPEPWQPFSDSSSSCIARWQKDSHTFLELSQDERHNLKAHLKERSTLIDIPPERIYIQWGKEYATLTPHLHNNSLYLFEDTPAPPLLFGETDNNSQWQEQNIQTIIDALRHFLKIQHQTHNHSPSRAQRFQECRDAVCRINRPFGRTGTGFVIGHRLLITNHHVLKDRDQCRNSTAEFFYDTPERTGTITVRFDPDTFFMMSNSPDEEGIKPLTKDELDFTIVALQDHPQLHPVFARPIPLEAPGAAIQGKGIYIIHHPTGQQKQICPPEQANNRIINIKPLNLPFSLIHTAAVDPGSSGSPLLSDEMKLIGLHRQKLRNNPLHKAAIKVDAIRSYLQRHPSPPAHSFWTQLLIHHRSVKETSVESSTPREHSLLLKTYQQYPYLERFSGKPLPLEDSYINLEMVKEEEQTEKETKLREKKKSMNEEEKEPLSSGIEEKSHHHHLTTFEENYAAKEPIAIEAIFAQQEKEKSHAPLRRLVLGKAGIGKSTFCHYAAYRWSQKQLWNKHFDWLFWIPLRELNQKKEIPLLSFIYKKWFLPQGIPESEFQTWWRKEVVSSQKVLLLLDGYDELSSEISLSHLLAPYNSFHILITSRPYSIPHWPDYQRLEITGFTDANITRYAHHCLSPDHADQLLQFFRRHPSIYGVAHIPIQLDLLCTLWQDPSTSAETLKTMTAAYYRLEKLLLRRSLQQLGELQPFSDREVEEKTTPETRYLSQLAFLAIQQENLLIPRSLIEEAAQKISQASLKKVLQLGLLKELDTQEYYFLHLTFQEYYAARHLISLFKENKIEAHRFILEQKYNPRLQIVFWFAAGLCCQEDATHSHTPPLIDQLLTPILEEPRDLIGLYETQLVVRLLEEGGFPQTQVGKTWEKNTASWIKKIFDGYRNRVYSYRDNIVTEALHSMKSVLQLSPGFVERFCLPLLKWKSPNKEDRERAWNIVNILETTNPIEISALLSSLNDPHPDVRGAACKALGNLKDPSPDVIPALLSSLNDPHPDVRGAACKALGNLKDPSPDVISALLLSQ